MRTRKKTSTSLILGGLSIGLLFSVQASAAQNKIVPASDRDISLSIGGIVNRLNSDKEASNAALELIFTHNGNKITKAVIPICARLWWTNHDFEKTFGTVPALRGTHPAQVDFARFEYSIFDKQNHRVLCRKVELNGQNIRLQFGMSDTMLIPITVPVAEGKYSVVARFDNSRLKRILRTDPQAGSYLTFDKSVEADFEVSKAFSIYHGESK